MNYWTLITKINMRAVMLLCLLCIIILSMTFLPRVISPPASEFNTKTNRQKQHHDIKKTARRIRDLNWESAYADTTNPFDSTYLDKIVLKEKVKKKKTLEALKEEKVKKTTKPLVDLKTKPDFTSRTLSALYRGIMTGTDGITIAILEIQSKKILILQKNDIFADNIRVTDFNPSQMTLQLPDKQQATLPAGKKKNIKYKIPRKDD